MRTLLPIVFILTCTLTYAQSTQSKKITTIDFVQVQNDNKTEAVFYYQNNWLVLREEAVKMAYIDSFQLMETETTPEAPFDIILITTYADADQFENREANFQEMINQKGGRELLNDKQPSDFRKIIFSKGIAKHLN